VVLLQVVALDLPPVCQLEDIRALPFNQECSCVDGGYMTHEFRITKPTIGDDHRRWQCHATSAERRHASIQHALEPVQFVPARPTRPRGIGPPDGKVHGHHQFPLAHDDHQEDAINP
jgi:hypothetical protein